MLLNPEFLSEEFVNKLLPSIDPDKCNFCGKCAEICEFNALLNMKFEIVLLDEMCHSCGACKYFCPFNAIEEKTKEIGIVRSGRTSENILFVDGLLNVGEIATPTLIKKVKDKIVKRKINILDSPPGVSCSMVETVKDSDFCLLVTESTPFGLSDLKLAIEVVKIIGKPFGVVINKYIPSFKDIEHYLHENSVEVLLRIPFERRFAEAYSKGTPLINIHPELKNNFKLMLDKIKETLGLGIND